MFLRVPREKVLTDGGINMKGNGIETAPLKKRANSLGGADWLRYSFSIWRNLGKTSAERRLNHPAMFTIKLVSRLLDVYTKCDGEVVLDPFAGSGTTLVAALEKNMRAVGLDINQQFRDAFNNRISLLSDISKCEYHLCDARALSAKVAASSVDICITSPPYWDILNRTRSVDGKRARPYSTDNDDLGNITSYGDFIDALGIVFEEVYKALKPKGLFILNVMDLRRGSEFYPLHMDVAEIAKERNLILDDIIIWDRQDDYNSLRPIGYPYKFLINKVHEYLLVFRK